MRRIFGVLSLLVLVLLVGYMAQTSGAVGRPGSTPPPELAHDFTLPTLTGQSVTLSRLRGQWVVLNFWATWCPPCVKEMPYLQQLVAERQLVVLGVNFNESAETAAQFVAEHGLTFPILLNPDDITLLVYQVRGLPRTFVIAPDGAIALRIVGEIEPAQFDAWLDEQAVGVAAR